MLIKRIPEERNVKIMMKTTTKDGWLYEFTSTRIVKCYATNCGILNNRRQQLQHMEETKSEGMFILGNKLVEYVHTNACGQHQTKIWDLGRWKQVVARLLSD